MPLLGGAPDDLVVDVGEVAHEGDVVAAEAQIAVEHVDGDQGARVADVRAVVDGDAAPVDADAARASRGAERLLAPGERVGEDQAHRALLLVLAQLGQHRVVFERRRVADRLLARGDVAQQAAHDLAAARLRQRVGEADVVGPREGADLLGDVLAQLLLAARRWRCVAGFER